MPRVRNLAARISSVWCSAMTETPPERVFPAPRPRFSGVRWTLFRWSHVDPGRAFAHRDAPLDGRHARLLGRDVFKHGGRDVESHCHPDETGSNEAGTRASRRCPTTRRRSDIGNRKPWQPCERSAGGYSGTRRVAVGVRGTGRTSVGCQRKRRAGAEHEPCCAA